MRTSKKTRDIELRRWHPTSIACLGLIQVLFLCSASANEEKRVFVSNEYFTFGSADYFTVAIKLADIDLDGDLDAIMINGRHWARQDLIFFNNGAGRFLTARPLGESATGYAPTISGRRTGWCFFFAYERFFSSRPEM